MADEETVPEIDWGSTRLLAPECGTVKKVEFSPYGDKQIVMVITTDVAAFQFAMFVNHIGGFTKGLAEIQQQHASRDRRVTRP
ncbi:MAG: hypothetical protein JO051_12290 [Acidobacteriaceae bacterium]|nr:hypothetical protein [Acidobacteriaceae bacterium]